MQRCRKIPHSIPSLNLPMDETGSSPISDHQDHRRRPRSHKDTLHGTSFFIRIPCEHGTFVLVLFPMHATIFIIPGLYSLHEET
ncbi:hypothetical protein BJX96DRAFT_142741 [Aspergillus floccosus]